MRKYFLLSAVALMAATSANATTDYAEVTARATIQVANQFTCDDVDFGTIVVKAENRAVRIFVTKGNTQVEGDDLISISNNPTPSCSYDWSKLSSNMEIKGVLQNKNGDRMDLRLGVSSGGVSYTRLDIPSDVEPGDYEGSITLPVTYE